MDRKLMHTDSGRAVNWAHYVIDTARIHGQRSGQRLFNSLTAPIAEKVRGTNFDPFYQNLSFDEVVKWYQDHIVFNDNGDMIAAFNGYEWLWEADKDAG